MKVTTQRIVNNTYVNIVSDEFDMSLYVPEDATPLQALQAEEAYCIARSELALKRAARFRQAALELEREL